MGWSKIIDSMLTYDDNNSLLQEQFCYTGLFFDMVVAECMQTIHNTEVVNFEYA